MTSTCDCGLEREDGACAHCDRGDCGHECKQCITYQRAVSRRISA